MRKLFVCSPLPPLPLALLNDGRVLLELKSLRVLHCSLSGVTVPIRARVFPFFFLTSGSLPAFSRFANPHSTVGRGFFFSVKKLTHLLEVLHSFITSPWGDLVWFPLARFPPGIQHYLLPLKCHPPCRRTFYFFPSHPSLFQHMLVDPRYGDPPPPDAGTTPRCPRPDRRRFTSFLFAPNSETHA